jgi:hypothetical protein
MRIVKSQNTLPRDFGRNRIAQQRIKLDLDDA